MKQSTFSVGDLVMRRSPVTIGIVYRITAFGPEEMVRIYRPGGTAPKAPIRTHSRLVTLEQAIVMFPSKKTSRRNEITTGECNLVPFDLVDLCTERARLEELIQGEVRRLQGAADGDT